MKIQGTNGTINFNLNAVAEMSETVFVKKMSNQVGDPKGVYKKLKAEIKRLADEEAKAKEEAEAKASKAKADKEAAKKKEAAA